MAWNDLKAAVAAVVKTNGTQAITGALLQSALRSIIDQVGANATFKGVATPTTTPGTPDGPLFYIAYEKGIYANFNGANITEGDGLIILLYIWTSRYWEKINIPLASKDELVQVRSDLNESIKNSFGRETSKVIASTLYDTNGDVITNTLPTTYGCFLQKNNEIGSNWFGGGITDYIIVNGLKQIHYSGYVSVNPASVAFCIFYDKDKNFISSLYTISSDNASGEEGEFTTPVYEMDIDVPINAHYARFTHNLNGGNLRITAGQYLENTWLIDVLRKAIENSVNEGFTYFLDKCICIGDSVTEGHVYDYPRTSANGRVIREQSYPTYLKKMTQWSIVENAARAGISVVSWWQTFYPNYTYTNYQVALMELGYNGGLTDTLDTDVEAYSNYNDYAETNTGCYCKIIEAIKEANPHIYLVLLIPSLWTPTSTGAIVIRKIAQKYNLPIIDLSDKTYMNLSGVKYHGLTDSDPNSINMMHFNAIGHCAKAKFIWDSLNKLFQINAKEVNDLQPGVV